MKLINHNAPSFLLVERTGLELVETITAPFVFYFRISSIIIQLPITIKAKINKIIAIICNISNIYLSFHLIIQ